MPAIKSHKTATDTKSTWDGPAEEAKMSNDEKELRYCHAWVSADGDPTAKSSWKFPHHAAGTDTPANISGVDNALARLSQANIPAADDAGVKEHLDAHRKDAGLPVSDSAASPETRRRHDPIRCWEGNAKPHEAFWRMRNAAETGGEPEMELYGPISEYSWFEDDVTPKMFKDALYALGGGGPITVRLNSPGGDVIAASVMRSIMADYPGRITVRIDGAAYSAAVLVAMSGSRIRIQDSAYMMIHDPAVMIFLAAIDIAEMASMLDMLKNIKAGILDVYAGKTGLSRDRLTRMMSDETWMSASEAVSLGFANEVIAGGNNQQKTNTAYVNALRNYVNVPPVLLRREQETADRLSREAQALRDQVQITK